MEPQTLWDFASEKQADFVPQEICGTGRGCRRYRRSSFDTSFQGGALKYSTLFNPYDR
jgi:hypothetical protein